MSLEETVKRIDQTLQGEVKTMKQTHSEREAEMRSELMAATEERTKLMTDLDAAHREVQRLLSVKEQQEEDIQSLSARTATMDAALSTAAQKAARDVEQLHTTCQKKDQQLGELREAMRVENEKHSAETVKLRKQTENALLVASEASHPVEEDPQLPGQPDLQVQVDELRVSRDNTLQQLSEVKGKLSHLQAASTATAADLRRQLDVAEQRIVNLTQRLKGSPPSSSPASANAVTGSLKSMERTMQQLDGMQKYVRKLADETADIREMEMLFRTLVELQTVLFTTQEKCVSETLEVEKLQATAYQALLVHDRDGSTEVLAVAPNEPTKAETSGNKGFEVGQTSTQMTAPADKQVILRTPSRDGEMPGAPAMAPAKERMNRRMMAPEKPILRASRNTEIGDSQSSLGDAEEAGSQLALADPFSGSQSGHRAFSKPVEGKSKNQGPGGLGAVQCIKTMLVGRAATEKDTDTLTTLAVWKSETHESQLPAGPENHTEVGQRAKRKGGGKSLESAATEGGAREEDQIERERKRQRPNAGRTRSQVQKRLPPSKQQHAQEA